MSMRMSDSYEYWLWLLLGFMSIMTDHCTKACHRTWSMCEIQWWDKRFLTSDSWSACNGLLNDIFFVIISLLLIIIHLRVSCNYALMNASEIWSMSLLSMRKHTDGMHIMHWNVELCHEDHIASFKMILWCDKYWLCWHLEYDEWRWMMIESTENRVQKCVYNCNWWVTI